MSERKDYDEITIRDQGFPPDPDGHKIVFTTVNLRDPDGSVVHSDGNVIRCTDNDLRTLLRAIQDRLGVTEPPQTDPPHFRLAGNRMREHLAGVRDVPGTIKHDHSIRDLWSGLSTPELRKLHEQKHEGQH